MPWRIATGLSLIVWVLALFLVGERLQYLAPYSEMLVERYALTVSLHLTAAAAGLFAFIYWLARRAGLGDVGGKIKLLDKRLDAGDAHDAELGRRLAKQREGALE